MPHTSNDIDLICQLFNLTKEEADEWMETLSTYLENKGTISTGIEQLVKFYPLLTETNAHTNLTRITSPLDFLNRHILDSLMLSPCIEDNASLIDIGTGAGFPSIPLSLFRPDLSITAVDSVGKKTQFITAVKENLTLNSLSVINNRAETLGQEKSHREQYDVATARAVADLPVLLELLAPLVKPSGLLLVVKGDKAEEELSRSNKAIHVLGLSKPEICEERGSTILIFEKERPTPVEYPRPAAKFKKNPL